MKHLIALAVVLVLAGVSQAQAIPPYGPPAYGPGYRPMLSPYLNLARPFDPATNYYLGTRPEFQRRQNDQLYRGQFRDILSELSSPRPGVGSDEEEIVGRPRSTGHPVAFNNTMGFFGGGTGQRPGQTGMRGGATPPRRR